MRANDLVLVEQGQLAGNLQHTLDHKHDIGTTRIIFVEHQRYRILQCPRQNAFLKFRHLLAVAQHNGIFADQIDTADMAVQIYAHAWPVQARRHLLDMGRFAGAVIALHHNAAVMGKAGQQRQCRVFVKQIVGVIIGHIFIAFGKSRYLKSVSKPKISRTETVVSGRSGIGPDCGCLAFV